MTFRIQVNLKVGEIVVPIPLRPGDSEFATPEEAHRWLEEFEQRTAKEGVSA